MQDGQGPCLNKLLAALPSALLQALLPQLERVEMPLGQVLCESGAQLRHVYFPTTAIVSLLYVMEDGASAEIAVVGFEGVVGVSLFMGGESTPSRAVVQSAGHGYRLPSRDIKSSFGQHGVVHPGSDHANGANGRLQPPSPAGKATLPVVVVEPGSAARQ